MKKIICFFALAFFGFQASAQESPTRYGLTAGYLNLNVTASYEGISASEKASGFYLGALAEFPLAGDLRLQPSINYGNAEDGHILLIPVMVKYFVAGSQFYVQGGPQGSFLLEETGDEINAFGVDLGIGAGFDITRNFFLEARYAFELTNRINNANLGVPEEVKSRINSFVAGVGYKF